ncbi:UDP-glucose 6-dehydrogenase [Cercophora newfieldiana]|uniref:UDP-glucose 6-dehydrogenase n=1 Tax=Cercophora newfieldiana TaxID=92897 RepID=A0AA40CJ77_9PEZI|nr:UDP-glucose 6-dehydrogenase [Cercophora newfieldiana]
MPSTDAPSVTSTPSSRTTATSPISSGCASPELKPVELTSVGPNVGHVKNVCFVGAGFVGGPTAAVIAYHNPQIQVTVVDLNEERISAWNSSHLPIHEDGLLKVVRIARDGTLDTIFSLPGFADCIHLKARQPNLMFSTAVVEAISISDIIFICVNTPTKTQGLGSGAMADISAIEGATRSIAKHARPGAIIVEKSTVSCGTARMIQEILEYHRPETSFEILSNPEFLAEGTAVQDLMHPDRILIGSAQTTPGLRAASTLQEVYAAWVPRDRIVTVNTFSSELSKLVANAMLAQRISSINSISAICEGVGHGADIGDVSLATGKDKRLGAKFLQAGVGFGGSCFEKDIRNLAYLAATLHLDVVVSDLNGSLRGKKISVLGFAFKDGTNDTRNSIAVHIIKDLANEMPREIAIFDPGCSPTQLDRVKICGSWRGAAQASSAVCVLTPWKQFRGCRAAVLVKSLNKEPDVSATVFKFVGKDLPEMDILELETIVRRSASESEDPLGRLKPLPSHLGDVVDWAEVAETMQEPRWVFDGRNVVDISELQTLGFRVKGIGKGF